ncbi:MAG: peptide chain release factor N(5)-glutamine methyltransferase [Clostridia bacterium]|nr:peptide chain release factor N(5)-glutamine methyltransferase [Clostridia bacterium]
MTVREALRIAADRLAQAGVPDARLDAEYLLAELLHTDRLHLIADGGASLSDAQLNAYEQWLARRERREPLQYVLGTQPFMGCMLAVSPAALIPRADTECLCEAALAVLKPGMRVLDLCTGTGALAIALKKHCPGADVCASDLSVDALALARENAVRNGADVRFFSGDLFTPLRGERFDLIVSNPPYIPRGELPGLQAEVRFEPDIALDGGEDGLDFYRRIAAEAPEHLNRNGWLMLEIGSTQAQDVSRLLQEHRFSEMKILPDLAGLDRVVCAYNGSRK